MKKNPPHFFEKNELINMKWTDILKQILKEESYADSKEDMIKEILDRMDSLKSELDESVTKLSLVRLIEALTSITLVTEEREVKEIEPTKYYSDEDEANMSSYGKAAYHSAGGDATGNY